MNFYQPCQIESFATINRFSYLTNHAGLLSTVPRLPFHLLYDYQPTFITMKRPFIIYRSPPHLNFVVLLFKCLLDFFNDK